MTKICLGCEKEKDLDDFHKDAHGKLGRKSRCKECISSYMNGWSLRPGIKKKKRDWLSAWNRRSPEHRLINSARARAKKSGIPFALTVKDIYIPSVCPVLGIPLKKGEGKLHDNSPTLDRLVDSLGYIPENITVVSYRANRIKNNGTAEEHLKIYEWMISMLQCKQRATSHDEIQGLIA